MTSIPGFRTLSALALVLALVLAMGTLAGCSDDQAKAQDHLTRAQEFVAKNDPRSAIVELKAALQLEPDNATARLELGRLYLGQGLAVEADKELQRAKRLGAKDPGLPLDMGRALLLSGKHSEALQHIDREGARDAPWRVLEGDAQMGLRRFVEARAAYEAAIAKDAQNSAAHRGLARSAMSEGQLDDARSHVTTALVHAEREVETWVLKGELEHSLQDFPASELSYRKVLELRPGLALGRLGLARALLAQEKADAAGEELAALEKQGVRSPLLHYLRALQARQKNDLAGAEKALREVLKVAPDHAPSRLLMGQINLLQRELDQAHEMLGRYVAQVPENPAGRKLLAAVQLELNLAQEAVETLAPLEASLADDAQLLSLLGTAHMKLGNLEKGRSYLDRASRTAPDTPAIRTQLAVSHLASGDTEKAAAELETVIDQEPDFARADFLLVLTHLRAGDRDAALAAVQRLVDKHPDSAEAQNLMGAVRESRRETDAARAAYTRSMELAPESRAGNLNLARLDLQGDDKESARKRFQSVLDKFPKDVTALMGLARMASDTGDAQESLRLLERARSENPEATRPRLVLANYHLRRGSPQKALRILEETSEQARSAPAVALLLGRAQLASGQREDAVRTFQELARARPKLPAVHFNLALAEQANGRLDAARAALLRTLELSDGNHLARATLGQVELRAGRYAEALALADRLAKDLPEAPASLVLRGDVALAQGDMATAIKAYQQGFGMAPNSQLLIKLFLAEQRAGRPEDARKRAETWLQEHPDDSRVRSLLAASIHQSGDPEKVLGHYEQVLKTNPRNVVALNNLAWMYYQRGDDRFLDLAKRAYDLVPGRPEVADTYGWLLVESGQVERGLTLIEQAYEKAPDNRDIGYHQAAALHRAGDTPRARKILESLLADSGKFSERAAAEALLKGMSAN